MTRRLDKNGTSASDHDDRLGEAIETYLALLEQGAAPDPEAFASRYPDLSDDIRAALEGLELVEGLVGRCGSSPTSSDPRAGPGRNLESGRRIAGYRVVRELGRGGMGTVYEAVHVGLDRPVALKVLNTHAAPDSSARRRFLNEARTAAGLHHTHIVPVFDVGQAGGLCYYAMQRIEGSGLERVIRYLRRSRVLPSGGSGSSDAGPAPLGPGPASVSGLAYPSLRAARSANDLTRSWLGSDTEANKAGSGGVPESRSVASGSLGPAVTLGGSRDDETAVPLDPPRGSAYFRWVAEIGLQAAEALAHAHHHGVIHRDVKPSNLLIDAEGTVWVTDFGLARRLADPGLTHHDSLLGTPRYMSPEQARTGAVDGRTDVYSLGATLYELLTLRPPFDGASAAELLEQIGSREPVAPRFYDRRIPRDLETIVLKTLAKRPGDRYGSAKALAEDLTRFLNREPVHARRISPIGRLWRVARRHPGISTVTTVASATVLAIATYAYLKILNERNVAVRASNDRAIALIEKKAEAEKAREAARWALFANASNLLLSELPDRRAKGLELLQQTADPEKAAQLGRRQPLALAQLRDQAVEFLVLCEVETRPEIPTGPTRGIEFGPGGTVLAALSEDGQEVSLWNMETRQCSEVIGLAGGRVAGAEPPHPPLRGTFPQRETVDSCLLPLAEGGRPDEGPSCGVAVAPPQPPASASAKVARSTSSPGRAGNGPAAGRFRRPGGNRLALAGHVLAVIRPDDHGLRLLDIRTGSLLHDLSRPGRTVLSVMANSASQRLLTVEHPSGPPPLPGEGQIEVIVWDLSRIDEPGMTVDRIKSEHQHPWSHSVAAAFSPDGKSVAVASNNKGNTFAVSLYSAENGQEKGRPIDTQSETPIALALGAGNVLATGAGNTIQLWDREAGTLLSSLSSNRSIPRMIRFNPQGTLLAVAGANHLEVWDTVSHRILAVLPATDWITDVSFAPDGRTLAIGRLGASTSVWQITDSAARLQLGGFDARVTSLAFRNSDGALAIGTSSGDVWLYRNGGNRCTSAPSTPDSGPESVRSNPASALDRERERTRWSSVAFDAQGRLLTLDPRGLRFWRDGSALSQPQLVSSRPLAHGRHGFPQIRLLARSADGQCMAVVRSSEVSLWRADQPERLRPISAPPMCPEDQGSSSASAVPPSSAAARHLLPEGEGVCSPSPSRERGELGEPARGSRGRAEGRLRGASAAPRGNIFAAQISPAGDRLYLLGDLGRLKIWTLASDVDDGPIEARQLGLTEELSEGLSSLALRSDGALLAMGDRLGGVTLLDTVSLKIQARIRPSGEEYQGAVLALAFSPDGRQLAVGSPQGQIVLWSLADPRSPQVALVLPGQRGMVRSLAFDATGQRLASTAGMEPLVEIWNLAFLGSELRRLGITK